MRRLLGPVAWILIGASLVATWWLIAGDSTEVNDDRAVMPTQTVEAQLEVRDGTADATLVVTYPTGDIVAQATGVLSSANPEFPSVLPAQGSWWADVDGRPRAMVPMERSFAFYRDLAKGDQGPDVAMLQTLLASLGHYDGEMDGNFGPGVEEALVAHRSQIGIETGTAAGDKRLVVGDLVVVSADADVVLADIAVGTLLGPNDVVGQERAVEPTLQVRFLPRDAQVVVPSAVVSGDEFDGVIVHVDREPLATEAGTVLTGSIEGTPSRDLAAGETLQVTVTGDVEPALWLPAGALAVDGSGASYVVRPDGERIIIEIGAESGGSVQVLSGPGPVINSFFQTPTCSTHDHRPRHWCRHRHQRRASAGGAARRCAADLRVHGRGRGLHGELRPR